MRRTLLLFISICSWMSSLQAQDILIERQVIASAGEYFENETMSISWTVGEVAIETLEGADIILTQGFQQPDSIMVIDSTTSIKTIALEKLGIMVFPNPVHWKFQ